MDKITMAKEYETIMAKAEAAMGEAAETIRKRKLIKCCICGALISEDWSNNAWPIVTGGRCCDFCNADSVVPARAAMAANA